MQFGYDVSKLPKLTRGESIFSEIDYDALRVVGAGVAGVVLTDGKYAIKIGYIEEQSYTKLVKSAEYGFSQPILYFQRKTSIDQRFIDVIYRDTVKLGSGGYVSDPDEFLYNDGSDIMISLYVKPFINPPQKKLEGHARADAYQVASQLARAYAEKTDERWFDNHPWNIGIYAGGLIIIDF